MSSEVSSSSMRNQEYEWKPPEVTRRPADTSTRGATPLDEEALPPHPHQQHHYQQQHHHRSSGNGRRGGGKRNDREDGEMSGSDMDVDVDRPSPGEFDPLSSSKSSVGFPLSHARRAIPPTIAQASSSSSSPRTPKLTSGMTPPLSRVNGGGGSGGATTAEADSLAIGTSPLVTASLADSSTPTQQLATHRSPLTTATQQPPPPPPHTSGRLHPLMPPSPYSAASQLPPPPAPPSYSSATPTSTSTSSQPSATDYMSYHASWAQDMGARAATLSQRYYEQQQQHQQPHKHNKHDPAHPPLPGSSWDNMQNPYHQYPSHPHQPPPSGPPPLMQTDQRLFPHSVPSAAAAMVDPQEKTIDKGVTRLTVDLKVRE